MRLVLQASRVTACWPFTRSFPLVATVEGTYTEGKPAPTEAHSLVADKDQTMIDAKSRKRPRFSSILERDADAAVPVSDIDTTSNGSTSNGSSDTADGNEGERDATSSQDREWLELGRQSVTVALVLMVLGEALMFTGFVGVTFVCWGSYDHRRFCRDFPSVLHA